LPLCSLNAISWPPRSLYVSDYDEIRVPMHRFLRTQSRHTDILDPDSGGIPEAWLHLPPIERTLQAQQD
jgi:hypothetical protein